jgi:transposase
MIAAYRHEDRRRGRDLMSSRSTRSTTGVPMALVEITKLGCTLKKRAEDVLAYFDHPAHRTEPPKRSTADSNTSAAPQSGSAT